MILTHPACLAHDPGPGHPESPARLMAALAALDDPRFAAVPRRIAPLASFAQLARAHDAALLEEIVALTPVEGRARLDPDTAMSPASLDATRAAAGALCAAIDAVMAGTARRAFCAVRPPGHHSTHARAMGFCLVNAIAVGACHALDAHGLERVAVVDFDVHHGNGTQDIFWDEPRVLFASSHQSPLYPGTGAADEFGGSGQIVNVPLVPGSTGEHFRAAWRDVILPAVDVFAPELLLISAGFDAHHLDPLADLRLGADDYAWVTRELVALAERHCGGRAVSTLEGGYSLSALRECTAVHAEALLL